MYFVGLTLLQAPPAVRVEAVVRHLLGNLRPLRDFVSLFVSRCTDDNHYKIYQRPDSEATKGYQLQNSCPYFSNIESMNTQDSKEKTEKKCRQDSLFTHRILLSMV